MFKIEMTFHVPDEALKFEKLFLLCEDGEPSCIVCSQVKDGQEKIIEGVKYIAKDECPHLPEIIDGARFKNLTEEEQKFYSFVEGDYLFEYKDGATYYPTDELSTADALALDSSEQID